MRRRAFGSAVLALLVIGHTEGFCSDSFRVDLVSAAGPLYTTVGNADASPPLLGQFEVSLYASLRTGNFLLGLGTGNRWIRQYTSVDPDIGNRAGSRWTGIVPWIGFAGRALELRFELQFMGDYDLSYTTLGGLDDLSYTDPLGAGLTYVFSPGSFFSLAAKLEYLRFAATNFGAGGITAVSSSLVVIVTPFGGSR